MKIVKLKLPANLALRKLDLILKNPKLSKVILMIITAGLYIEPLLEKDIITTRTVEEKIHIQQL